MNVLAFKLTFWYMTRAFAMKSWGGATGAWLGPTTTTTIRHVAINSAMNTGRLVRRVRAQWSSTLKNNE